MNHISDILTASYSTSREAFELGRALKSFIGAENNYEVIRLALGRSLGLESHPDSAPDAKGAVIKGLQLFGDEDSCNYLWIGLLGEALRRRGEATFSIEALQKLVRDHWHRGAQLLNSDREEAEGDFRRFLDILARKANLPERAPVSLALLPPAEDLKPGVLNDETRDAMLKHLRTAAVTAEIRETFAGPRIDRYKLYLPKAADRNTLENRIDDLGFALGVGREAITLTDASEPRTCFLDVPRPQATWHAVNVSHFAHAVASFDLGAQTLPVSPGVCIDGKPLIFDLASAPHLLIGGTTGSGKSVCMSAILLSLLTYAEQRPLRFALIDPKQVEFAAWKDCPWLFDRVATDNAAANSLLELLVAEMEARYGRFAELGVRDLAGARARGYDGAWIVVVVDELADLVMQDKDNEKRLVLLAQKARAAGIHLMLATQRPDAKTFSGLLRTNCPARIALRVARASESKIVMDEAGAERLQGAGDMIFRGGDGGSIRAHAYHIRSEDISSQLKR